MTATGTLDVFSNWRSSNSWATVSPRRLVTQNMAALIPSLIAESSINQAATLWIDSCWFGLADLPQSYSGRSAMRIKPCNYRRAIWVQVQSRRRKRGYKSKFRLSLVRFEKYAKLMIVSVFHPNTRLRIHHFIGFLLIFRDCFCRACSAYFQFNWNSVKTSLQSILQFGLFWEKARLT